MERFSQTKMKVAIALVGALVGTSAGAATIQNGNFETGNFNPVADETIELNPGDTDLAGWTILTDDIAWIGAGNPWGLSASNGNRFIDLTGFSDTAPMAGVSQDIATDANSKYKLVFDLGSSARYNAPIGVEVNVGGISQDFNTTNVTGIDIWETFILEFTATSSVTTLTFLGIKGFQYVGLDNISILGLPENGTTPGTTPVPVPASALLLFSALVGLRRFKATRAANVGTV